MVASTPMRVSFIERSLSAARGQRLRRPVLAGVAALVAISVVTLVFVAPGRDSGGDRSISADTVVEGDLTIARGSTTVLKDGARLTVRGKLDVSGTLACENGGLSVGAGGALVVNGSLVCQQGEKATPGSGIAIVAGGNVTFAAGATVRTDGSVQIVDRPERLARTATDLEAIFEDIGRDAGEGVRVGPFLPDGGGSSARSGLASIRRAAAPVTAAPTVENVRISGRWDLTWAVALARLLAPDRRSVVLIDANARRVELGDLTMQLPAGVPGRDDLGADCDRRGGDGKPAGRLSIRAAETVRVYASAAITFGDGGRGGSATTGGTCYPTAHASGGRGAESGNLKVLAGSSIVVEDVLRLVPGAGGVGGNATATAANAPRPGMPGGTATAVGGKGGDNRKQLRAVGAVSGVERVEIASVLGGRGGDAAATSGSGAGSTGCRTRGGDGGAATATGGAGGDASLRASGARRAAGAEDGGGEGGDAAALANFGGAGGHCGPQGPGGDGGDGGDARATGGAGGSAGLARRALAGVVTERVGGAGGRGGDGCPAGEGGSGGEGLTRGRPGSSGTRACAPPAGGEAVSTMTPTPTPTASPTPTGTPTPTPVATPRTTPSPTLSLLVAELSFAHTRPGVQSEVYLDVRGAAGMAVTATLTGPGVASAATQTGTTNAADRLRLTWVITAFGTYRASGTAGGSPINVQVNVQ